MERLHLSDHCAEPGRKYNERKSAERFLCYHSDTEESLLYFSQTDQSLKNYSSFANGLIKFDFSYNLNRSVGELLVYPFEENV